MLSWRTAVLKRAAILLLFPLLLAGLALAEGPDSSGANVLVDPDPAWHRCRSVLDCTMILGFCGYPEAVNRNHAEAYRNWIENGPPTHCALMPPPEEVCITCQENRCFARRRGEKPLPPPGLGEEQY